MKRSLSDELNTVDTKAELLGRVATAFEWANLASYAVLNLQTNAATHIRDTWKSGGRDFLVRFARLAGARGYSNPEDAQALFENDYDLLERFDIYSPWEMNSLEAISRTANSDIGIVEAVKFGRMSYGRLEPFYIENPWPTELEDSIYDLPWCETAFEAQSRTLLIEIQSLVRAISESLEMEDPMAAFGSFKSHSGLWGLRLSADLERERLMTMSAIESGCVPISYVFFSSPAPDDYEPGNERYADPENYDLTESHDEAFCVSDVESEDTGRPSLPTVAERNREFYEVASNNRIITLGEVGEIVRKAHFDDNEPVFGSELVRTGIRRYMQEHSIPNVKYPTRLGTRKRSSGPVKNSYDAVKPVETDI